MKHTLTIFAMLLITTLFSCKKEDDSVTGKDPNAFYIASTAQNYTTENAYIIFDDGPVFNNGYILALADATMREDNVNGISSETSLTHGMAIHIKNATPSQVNSEQGVNISVGTFQTDEESSAITGVTNFQDIYTHNGTQYGDIDGGTEFIQDGNGSGSLVINNFTIDYTARTGTIDCDCVINTALGDQITAHYDGSFKILNGF